MKPYYYVYNKEAPTIRHETLESAQRESMRLAKKHPGDVFRIMKCVAETRCDEPSTVWMDGEQPQEPVEDQAPQPQEGFLLFGKGPLKVLPSHGGMSCDIIYKYRNGSWSDCGRGDESLIYAIRAGTQLARDNGLEVEKRCDNCKH